MISLKFLCALMFVATVLATQMLEGAGVDEYRWPVTLTALSGDR